MNKNRQRQRNGFTLVEVAIVIVFMGIFITFASSMLKGIALSSKSRAAREKLATVSDLVQASAVNPVNNRAIPLSTDLFESATGAPVDYWNKSYAFYPYTPEPGAVLDICRRSSTDLAVCLQGDCVNKVIRDVAYVLVSGAEKCAGACTATNLPIQIKPPFVTTVNLGGPCTGRRCIPLNEISTTFDDLYKYVTLLELKKTVGCVEADSRLRILNMELPYAREGVSYTTVIQADGGAALTSANKYNWCRNATSPSDLVYSPDVICPLSTAAPSLSVSSASPTVDGTRPPITITVKDANNITVDKSFVLTVVIP